VPMMERERNPHDLPVFDAQGDTPVLYLPPLLAPPATTTDVSSLSLHKSLHHFRPTTPDYACTAYADAFNWHELEVELGEEERAWYCVVFRSRRKEGCDAGREWPSSSFASMAYGAVLYEADRLAHQEAIQNGGLIMYWYGVPHPSTRANLATCIWQTRQHAIAANCKPFHIRAMKLASSSYDIYDLERYTLRKVRGEKGVRVERYVDGKVDM
jgi:hypothetical protein